MSAKTEVSLLVADLRRCQAILEKIDAFYRGLQAVELQQWGKNRATGILVAEVLVDYYTCLETAFLRVSQFFENNLKPERWHQDLLERMSLRVEGVREPVLSDESRLLLLELLKFRHFKRYYFEFDYDWEKLDFLLLKYERARQGVSSDFASFLRFLEGMT